ncbi:MAG: DUF3592 domain-containing protein [Lentisphaerae bacterium]|nr:DUF3592 domain-containing protein [Lentisphaerota bacterium]
MARIKGGGFGGMLFFTLFWCSITGVFVGFLVYGFARATDAKRRFVPAEGRVIESAVDTHSDSDGNTYGFRIRYSYEAGGTTHEGKRYAFGEMKSSDGQTRARQLVRQHPAGSAITVYYDPGDPADSVIVRDPDPSLYFMLLFLTPFVLVGLGMGTATFMIPAKRRAVARFMEAPARVPWEIPGWGVMRQDFDGYVVRPRASPGGLLMAGAIGIGVTCFVGIFVVGIFGGGFGAARPAVALGVVGLGLGLGGLAAWRTAAAARKKAVFSIDPSGKTLRLHGPARNVTVPFHQIARWKVRRMLNPRQVKREGDPPEVPIVALDTASGEEVPVHVFGAGRDEADIARKVAHAFSHWTGHAVPDIPVETDARPSFKPGNLREAIAEARKQSSAFKSFQDLV